MTTHSNKSVLKPADADQALEAVRWAISEETPLELVGKGSKRKLGRPFQATHTLDLSDLTGVTLYEPEELVLSARAGTPLAELEALLAENRQQFAFEPTDFGPLLGGEAGKQTIGGVVSCNLAGPRRVKAGAARDHFLGFQAISGRGEAFKAGGRVVKNVTGYDLSKLIAGSYGTLTVLTEVTLKVLPAPEDTRTVLIRALDDATAIRVMALALQSPYEVAGAAHVPASLAGALGVEEVAGGAATAIRLEGFGPSIEYRAGKLRDLLGGFGTVEFLDRQPSLVFWAALRDVKPFVSTPERLVWRLSVPPADGARVVADIKGRLPGAEAYFDWGGGLVWLAIEPGADGAGQAAIRGAIGLSGGHATLVRAPDTIRASADVFQPQQAPLAALSARVKETLDPKRIFNPGRMYAGV
ncbi:2-hydroxy-acid oxidase [Skermanella stibiiresistens SB22]|uniref:2-hydroxy-acid oxidase n=1 Tax=Skermanella stibiiresistens SB22 TaxID=1385369 RepID=W9GXU9_9PROT|nr:glycolate oxidase subunit GlcE [Skermanella stibiiresistens]EWY37461.1 2-hydroxy-acid oxidase [Skermanella stibiiresistens SB22]